MAIVTQWHLLVVTVRNNTSEEKEDKEEMLVNTKSLSAFTAHGQVIQHWTDSVALISSMVVCTDVDTEYLGCFVTWIDDSS